MRALIIAALMITTGLEIQPRAAERWYLVREENDAFLDNTDNAYTQGLELERVDQWEPTDSGVGRNRFGVRNMIYTPSDISLKYPSPYDRPYAGVSAATYTRETSVGAVLKQQTIMLGVLGPSSHSDDVQSGFHAMAGFRHPEGWGSQLEDEPVLNTATTWNYRLLQIPLPFSGATDVTPSIGYAAGTLLNHAAVGGTWRAGFNAPDAELTHLIRVNASAARWRPVAFAFGSIEARYVLHNTLVDGSLVQSGPGVESADTVFTASYGATVGVTGVRVRNSAYSLLVTGAANQRSREYDGQLADPRYATISVAVGRAF